MKVLVHLKKKVNRSYMFSFGSSVTKSDISRVLQNDNKDAIGALLGYAASQSALRVSVPRAGKRKAQIEADFVLSQSGYIAERLA